MIRQSGLISVIMPAYNCSQYVVAAIESVLNQTYSAIELLIADDCSTDNTKEVIDSYSDERIKRHHNLKNLGYLKSCNLLCKQAKGEYITFLDADDINTLDRFEKQIKFLSENKDVKLVGSNIIRINSESEEIGRSNFYLKNEEMKREFSNYRTPCHYSSLLINAEVIDDIGLYDEYFDRIGSEDTYWFSFVIEKYKVSNIPDYLYYYRKHQNSVTATHKNPKAFVGHDLIIHFYKKRCLGKKDYIKSGEWKNADVCCKFIELIKDKKKNGLMSYIKFIGISIQHPVIATEFARQFISQK